MVTFWLLSFAVRRINSSRRRKLWFFERTLSWTSQCYKQNFGSICCWKRSWKYLWEQYTKPIHTIIQKVIIFDRKCHFLTEKSNLYILESAIHKYCSSSNGHLPSLYCDLKPQTCSAKYFEVNKNTVYSMPTMTFSFVCHTAVLPIYAELGGGEGQEKGARILTLKCQKVRKIWKHKTKIRQKSETNVECSCNIDWILFHSLLFSIIIRLSDFLQLCSIRVINDILTHRSNKSTYNYC